MSQSGQSDPLLGRILDGKFTLLSVLGRGGMGVVYRAHQQSLERPVALKLMMASPPVDDGEEAREEEEARQQEYQRRFFLEAATAAKLKHPNTITVFDYGSTLVDGDKVFYITMELLDGITLSRLLARQGPLPPLRAINIALQMCRSLREAHVDGIVHRDLKPGNVMLVRHDAHGDGDGDVDGDGDDDDGDFVKVLDFGLAKNRSAPGMPARQLTKAGTFLGSPRYVAPEQIEGRPVDGRADIYSFGCVFYRMLTGRVPFDGQQAVQVMLKHLHDRRWTRSSLCSSVLAPRSPASCRATSASPMTCAFASPESLAKAPTAGRCPSRLRANNHCHQPRPPTRCAAPRARRDTATPGSSRRPPRTRPPRTRPRRSKCRRTRVC